MAAHQNPTAGNSQMRRLPPVTNRAHPRVYAILIALTVWFVLAVWNFAGGGVTDYLLFIVSGFIGLAVLLPLILFRVGRVHGAAASDADQPPLHEWMKWDYDTWTGRLSGSEAALQILLPIAAAAIGMTAIGIAFRVAAG